MADKFITTTSDLDEKPLLFGAHGSGRDIANERTALYQTPEVNREED